MLIRYIKTFFDTKQNSKSGGCYIAVEKSGGI
jgi:hypothetical protein